MSRPKDPAKDPSVVKADLSYSLDGEFIKLTKGFKSIALVVGNVTVSLTPDQLVVVERHPESAGHPSANYNYPPKTQFSFPVTS